MLKVKFVLFKLSIRPGGSIIMFNLSVPTESFKVRVGDILNEKKTAGYYTLEFNAEDIASGVYIYRMESKVF